jgi:hypothetical protein
MTRVFIGPVNHDHPGNNEGKAEQLAHIKLHPGFKRHLVIFYKFNEEPCRKEKNHKNAEYKPIPDFHVFLAVKDKKYRKDEDIA